MPDAEELAGISIGISANTSQIESSLSKLTKQLDTLDGRNITVGIQANQASIKTAIADIRKQIVETQKTPIPVRLQMKVGQKVAGQLGDDLAQKMGQIPVTLIAAGDSVSNILATLKKQGTIVVPVSAKWDGTWEGEPPGGGGTRRPPTGGAPSGGTPVPNRPGPGYGGTNVPPARSRPAQATATGPAATAAAGTAAGEVIGSPRNPTATPPSQAGPTGGGHPEAGNLQQANQTQAQTRVNRGIYRSTDEEVVAARKRAEESAGIPRGLQVNPLSPYFKRYKAAGGDIPSLVNLGIARPLAGREAEYFKEFGQEAIARRQAAGETVAHQLSRGIDARSARAAGFGAVHDPAALAANVDLYEQATQLAKASYKESEEYGAIHGRLAPVFKASPTGELIPTGEKHPVYEGKAGETIEALRDELAEALSITDPRQRIQALGEISRGAFAIGGMQRTAMEGRATAGGHPGRGTRRFRSLIGQKVKTPKNINEQAILDVRSMALAALEETGRTMAVLEGEEAPESAEEFKEAARKKFADRQAQGGTKPPKATPPKQKTYTGNLAVKPTSLTETQKETVDRLKAGIASAEDELTKAKGQLATWQEANKPEEGKPAPIPPATITQSIARREKQIGNLHTMLEQAMSGKTGGTPVGSSAPLVPGGPRAFSGGPAIPVSGPLTRRIAEGPASTTPATDRALHRNDSKIAAAVSALATASSKPAAAGAEPFVPVWRRRAGFGKDLTGGPRAFAGLAPEVDYQNFNPKMAEDAARYQADRAKRSVAGRIARQTQLVGSYEGARAKLEAEGLRLPPPPRARSVPVAAAAADVSSDADKEKYKQRLMRAGQSEADAHLAAYGEKLPAGTGGGGGGRGRKTTAATPPGGEPPQIKLPTSAQIRAAIGEEGLDKIREDSEKATQDIIQNSQNLQLNHDKILRENPVRALSVAVGQFLAQTVGGRNVLEKQVKVADKAQSDVISLARKRQTSQARLTEAEEYDAKVKTEAYAKSSKLDEDELKAVRAGALETKRRRKSILDARDAELKAAQENAAKQEQQLAKVSKFSTLRTLGVGGLGVIAGTQIFSAAISAVGLAEQQIGIGLGRIVDRLTNFEEATGTLVGQLSDQARANAGNVKATVASASALSGLGDVTAATINPLIEQRTTIVAGTKALEDQFAQLHAFENVQANRLPGGFDRALVSTTGGFPIGQIGGQRAPLEIIGNEIAGNKLGVGGTAAVGGGLGLVGGALAGAALGTAAGPGIGTLAGAIIGGGLGLFGGAAAGGGLGALSDLADLNAAAPGSARGNIYESATNRIPGKVFSPGVPGGVPPRAPNTAVVSALDLTLQDLNENAKKGNSQMRFLADPKGAQATHDALVKLAKDLNAPEIKDFADKLLGKGVSITGGALTSGNVLGLIQAVTTGALQQSPAELRAANARQMRASLQMRSIQGTFERQQLLPAQAFLAQQAQPLIPFAATAAARTPGAQQAPNFKAASADIASAQKNLQGFADQGERAAEALTKNADEANKTYGITTHLADEWKTATAAVGDTGKKIAEIGLADTWMQVNYQTHQYDNELRIANRSLADAKSFITGIGDAQKGNLGVLEHQSRELDIQNTKLGFQAQALAFELQQRQINFQVAAAGFVAPGTTPEERAARVEQAKIEAQYAQKQLDIQKQQFGIAQKQFGITQQTITIQASRTVTDLTRQLALLTEGRQVNISVAIDQERLNALQKQMDQQLAQAQSVLQQATDTRQQVYEQDAAIAAQIGTDIANEFSTLIHELEKALGIVNTDLTTYGENVVRNFGATPGGQAAGSGPGGAPSATGPYMAAGFLGNINGATQMVVGEAGKETVAVIRNPREMTDQLLDKPSSSPTVIQITVTGNTINSEKDADALVKKISRAVEESINRKSALLGFRP